MGPMIVQGYATTAVERRAMVDNQIRTFDVTDQRVLDSFSRVPRELFVAPAQVALAYSDGALIVRGDGQTRRPLLAPMVLARMIQGLGPRSSDKVLVVAGGTGYAAAMMATLSASVIALEADPALVAATKSNAAELGLDNVVAVEGVLAHGHQAQGPYDSILICGAVEVEPTVLLNQLSDTGRLVVIQVESHEASLRSGKVTRYDRTGTDMSSRVVFDATAPILPSFNQPARFVF